MEVSLFRAVPRPNRAFARRGGNGFVRWIAESQQDIFYLVLFLVAQPANGRAKCFQPKIVLACGAFDAVEEGGNFNQFVTGIEEVKVQNLLSCHNDLRFATDGLRNRLKFACRIVKRKSQMVNA